MQFTPSVLITVALAACGVQASPAKRDSTVAVNIGYGSCAKPTGSRGPIEGFNAQGYWCSSSDDSGCCTVDTSEHGTYAWIQCLTNGEHGHIQAFSDAHCSEDASPIVDFHRGPGTEGCVDANNSGKNIGSYRITA